MPKNGIVTRFAPSPTGLLHIGGARTALFNWLFAKANGGRFLLRIEDTDRSRHSPAAESSIVEDLRWLGLEWDGSPIRQSERQERHREVAFNLLESGSAYRCYSTPEEIQEFKNNFGKPGAAFLSPWRDADPATFPDRAFAIRLRMPRKGSTVLEDRVYGKISWRNETLEDLVISRLDGSPTYNLAATVDDHDSAVSHVIRGDDHLANTAKQILIREALAWTTPIFAHVPLIHGESGKKLSKRDGAAGLEHYRKAGYHPEAVRNYLTRLGWSHGDDEVFTVEQAVSWFGLDGLRKSPARLNEKKIASLSRQHMAAADDDSMVSCLSSYLRFIGKSPISDDMRSTYARAMYCLKAGSKSFLEIDEKAHFLRIQRPISLDADARRILAGASPNLIAALTKELAAANWNRDDLESLSRNIADFEGIGFGKVAQLIRLSLCGRKSSPSVFDMMAILGRTESLARLEDALVRGE
ncbi:MAG: glutamate--tRNA ligase [Albidovulum sp.]|nr:glutamate--tRNA ligase [Albidovulum sp.]